MDHHEEQTRELTQLQQQAAEVWTRNQQQMMAQLDDQAAAFAASPDVLMRPDPTIPWSYEGVVCPCGGRNFLVQRWVTISGKRHRFESICTSCRSVNTWDWSEGRWL